MHKPKAEIYILFSFILLKLILVFVFRNPVYELHRDEFLHLDQGGHLAPGYLSVPPVTSLFAWLIRLLGNGEIWVRLIPAFIGCGTLIFSWLIVGELKGNLYAKFLVALAVMCSAIQRLDMLFQPNAFDIFSWTALFYFLICYFNYEKPKYLYLAAVCVAVGFLNKYSILFLIMGLVPALLITPQRKIFANKHLYLAVLLALVIISPNIIWQFQNHFPVVHHMNELAERQLVNVSRLDFMKSQLLFVICDVLIILGAIVAFIFYRPFRPYRWIGLTYVFTIGLFLYFKAKSYYSVGLYPVLLAVGSAYIAAVFTKRWMRIALPVFIVLLYLPAIPLTFPLYSPQKMVSKKERFAPFGILRWEDGKNHDLPQDFADMQGWKELAGIVDSMYTAIPDKANTIILTDNYGQAGAINYYTKVKGLQAVSFNADYINWFKLDAPIHHVILIKDTGDRDPERKREKIFFDRVEVVGMIRNNLAREYETKVFLLDGPKIDVNRLLKEEIVWRKQDMAE
ncbi:glycosyl transferase [Chitinophaga sp. SYP-B3965]|uniref:glycosyltransferase family 39 protein n=1 Tax=Chitinophaga sp. SYP-B3965 TaxID=2663120 RepID=UPI0012997561|nr:glycosyltransferase family 39 protein [Chitinophaga sp. SYP-B3965]MRG44988.1 glycosyl transferase [Chitinophaga sp. SYP-B3965]